jgi:sulfite reductase alpha subunit-like flavoprotein
VLLNAWESNVDGMWQDVARAAVTIVEQAEGLSTGAAEAVLKRMSDAGRIQKDVW